MSIVVGLVIPSLSRLCGTSPARADGPAFLLRASPCRIHHIVRDVLDNGLRLLTEQMTAGPVRQHRRLADARLAARIGRARRHRPLRRAHAVQGHGDPDGRGHRAGDRFDWRPARRVHRQGIRELLHQGARRAPAARDRHPVGHRAATRRSAPATSSARRRSCSKRSRWSRTRPTIWCTSCSRRASGKTIRSAGRFSAARRRSNR